MEDGKLLLIFVFMHEIEHLHKTFEHVDLQDTVVMGREFIQCTFNRCTLGKTTFEDCYFEDCEFLNCDLCMLNVTASSFRNVRFTSCKMLAIQWYKASDPIQISFSGCAISYSTFYKQNLKKCTIVGCVAKEVTFIETDLEEADFSDTDLEGTLFQKANLKKANFEGAKNYFINLENNQVKKAIFTMPEAMTLLTNYDIVLKY